MLEYDLAGALVAGQSLAEFVDLLLRAGHALLDLDDGGGDLAKTGIGQADHGHVLDLVVGAQEVLDLHRVDVLAARDDDVLFAVHQVDEAVLVLAGHIAGVEPAVVEHLICGLGVLVVALHDAGAVDGQLAHVAGLYGLALFIDDLGLPAVARLADGAHLVDVVHAQVHAAGADGLGQAVVGVVLVVREDLEPAVDEAGRHGLRADVHQPPLVKVIVVQVHTAGLDGVQQVLRPGHQQPDDGALFLGDGAQDPLGLDAAQQHGLAARQQRAEPVHLGAGVVQRRDAQEHVVAGLAVVVLLHLAGAHQRAVVVQYGLGEARGARGEVDGRVVRLGQLHRRRAGGAEGGQLHAVLGVGGRRGVAHEEQRFDLGQVAHDGVHAGNELRPEHQHLDVGKIQAVLNLVAGIAEVHGNGDAAGLEHAEVDGQPFQAVHQQDAHLGAPLDAPAEQQVGKAVGAAVKIPPAHLAAVGDAGMGAFDQIEVAPGDGVVPLVGGIDLHQRGLGTVQPGVSLQEIRDDHLNTPLLARI